MWIGVCCTSQSPKPTRWLDAILKTAEKTFPFAIVQDLLLCIIKFYHVTDISFPHTHTIQRHHGTYHMACYGIKYRFNSILHSTSSILTWFGAFGGGGLHANDTIQSFIVRLLHGIWRTPPPSFDILAKLCVSQKWDDIILIPKPKRYYGNLQRMNIDKRWHREFQVFYEIVCCCMKLVVGERENS